jgi:hypothetical protein
MKMPRHSVRQRITRLSRDRRLFATGVWFIAGYENNTIATEEDSHCGR